MKEGLFTLKDGRKLCYAQYGNSFHRPVIYFHGTPSSRLEPQLLGIYGHSLESMLEESNLQLIAIDRPGMGLSGFNPKGSFLSFAEDVNQLCQSLNIRSCPVLCWSGGGPYALALASKYFSLVSSVHIIAGFTCKFNGQVTSQMGMNKWYFLLSRYASLIMRLSMNLIGQSRNSKKIPQKITGLPYVDYKLIEDPRLLESFSRFTMKQAVRFGAKGAVYEARGYYKDTSFRLREIEQPIHYWWGTKDMTVIRLHPEALEREAPNITMHYRENEGHLSIYVNCFREILQQIKRSLDQNR